MLAGPSPVSSGTAFIHSFAHGKSEALACKHVCILDIYDYVVKAFHSGMVENIQGACSEASRSSRHPYYGTTSRPCSLLFVLSSGPMVLNNPIHRQLQLC